ncbi:MAG: hypothetical protein IPN86_02615 [Saprospiraceae bacterium]|nr:hypothetical protein [Saprospiraceae bacterium]
MVLEFVSFANVNQTLGGLDGGLIGGSPLKKGQIIVNWFDANGKTLASGTRIFFPLTLEQLVLKELNQM